MTATGKVERTKAIWRHERNIEIDIAANAPKFTAIWVSANSVPRIDLSLQMTPNGTNEHFRWGLIVFSFKTARKINQLHYLISLTYIADAAFLSPIRNSSKKNAKQTIENDWAVASIKDSAITGSNTSIMVVRRPNASERKPLRKPPINTPAYDMHTTCDDTSMNGSHLIDLDIFPFWILTQPWCLSTSYSNRIIWFQCGSDTEHWWD